MVDFSISLPTPAVCEEDSENEDMVVRRRGTLAEEQKGSIMEDTPDVWKMPHTFRSDSVDTPSVWTMPHTYRFDSVPEEATAASSSKDIAVDLDNSSAEELDGDGSEDQVPKLITRDMVVALWKKAT